MLSELFGRTNYTYNYPYLPISLQLKYKMRDGVHSYFSKHLNQECTTSCVLFFNWSEIDTTEMNSIYNECFERKATIKRNKNNNEQTQEPTSPSHHYTHNIPYCISITINCFAVLVLLHSSNMANEVLKESEFVELSTIC